MNDELSVRSSKLLYGILLTHIFKHTFLYIQLLGAFFFFFLFYL